MAERAIHFPGLNGLRAFAALSVVVSHVTLGLDKFGLDPYLFGAFDNGAPRGLDLATHGVTIFFALSGFLITSLLLAERGQSGANAVNIRFFYVRRILRIWPLYYSYLALVLVFLCLQGRLPSWGSIGLYTFFAANVAFVIPAFFVGPVAHFWSLAVEEQFYIFWPWVLRRKTRDLLWICIGGILLQFTLKVVFHFLLPGSLAADLLVVTRFHCMLIGASAAVLHANGSVWFQAFTTHRLTQLGAWAVVVLLVVNRFHIASVIDGEIVACVTVVLIMGQISATRKVIDLERAWLDRLGKISYGIYVVHPLIIHVMTNWMNRMFDQVSWGGGISSFTQQRWGPRSCLRSSPIPTSSGLSCS